LSIFIFGVLYFFVNGLVGLCCKPQPLVTIIIIIIICCRWGTKGYVAGEANSRYFTTNTG